MTEVFQAPQAPAPQLTETIVPGVAQEFTPAPTFEVAPPPEVLPVIVLPVEPSAPETPESPEQGCAGLGSLLLLLGLGELLGLC